MTNESTEVKSNLLRVWWRRTTSVGLNDRNKTAFDGDSKIFSDQGCGRVLKQRINDTSLGKRGSRNFFTFHQIVFPQPHPLELVCFLGLSTVRMVVPFVNYSADESRSGSIAETE